MAIAVPRWPKHCANGHPVGAAQSPAECAPVLASHPTDQLPICLTHGRKWAAAPDCTVHSSPPLRPLHSILLRMGE